MIQYAVAIEEPHRHQLRVETIVPDPGTTLRVQLPAWTPGSYLIREFSRYLGEVSAFADDGTALVVSKAGKGTWEIAAGGAGSVRIRYDVYGHELTVRTPHVDGTHAFFTGTNLLLRVDGRDDAPCSLRVSAPSSWEVACSLPVGDDGSFTAPNYDVMADGFVEAGPHRRHTFDVLGVPHHFVFWGDERVDLQLARLEDDVRAIVETNAATFDGSLPYDDYLFVFHITDTARGGLEHLTGTALATPWRYFDTDEGYREMLGLISHEHFHVWNVKRIRPQALGPFDYHNENYTTALWVAEGFTSYFDSLGCLRAGVWERDHYLDALGKDIQRYLGVPGRHVQSVAASSFDAWIRLYRPDENTPNRTVSYYLKGSMVALALDLHIRSATGGDRHLGHALHALWSAFKETGDGFDEHAVDALISSATGVDVRDAVAAWVFGTDDPPLSELLATHGLSLGLEADKTPWTGIDVTCEGPVVTVKHVYDDGPNAGTDLYPGDVLAAVDHRRVTSSTWSDLCARLSKDEPATLHLFRRGELRTSALRATEAPARNATVAIDDDAAADAVALRNAWWSKP